MDTGLRTGGEPHRGLEILARMIARRMVRDSANNKPNVDPVNDERTPKSQVYESVRKGESTGAAGHRQGGRDSGTRE